MWKMWVAANWLFVLVGATVNIGYLSHVGLKAVVFNLWRSDLPNGRGSLYVCLERI